MDVDQNSGKNENKGCLDSLAYVIGWLVILSFLIPIFMWIIAMFTSAVTEPLQFFEMLKIHTAYFWATEYAAPITTGVFLGFFTLILLRKKEKERPILDFLLSLISASFFTLFVIVCVSYFLSYNP